VDWEMAKNIKKPYDHDKYPNKYIVNSW
jgi:hypothetical protein